jgi:hypothetical protein
MGNYGVSVPGTKSKMSWADFDSAFFRPWVGSIRSIIPRSIILSRRSGERPTKQKGAEVNLTSAREGNLSV